MPYDYTTPNSECDTLDCNGVAEVADYCSECGLMKN